MKDFDLDVSRWPPAASDPWRGEVFGGSPAGIPEGEPVVRLTYNPRFAELLDRIDGFIAANSF